MNRRELFSGLFGVAIATIASKVKLPVVSKSTLKPPLDPFSEELWKTIDFNMSRKLEMYALVPHEPKFMSPPKLPQFVIDMIKNGEIGRNENWSELT